jgi:hypothetical protein
MIKKQINKKVTLSSFEKTQLLLGSINEKQTEAYTSAKKHFETWLKIYAQCGTIHDNLTKLWFDPVDYSWKMTFCLSVEKEQLENLLKTLKEEQNKSNKETEALIEQLHQQFEKQWKKVEPELQKLSNHIHETLEEIFSLFVNKKAKNDFDSKKETSVRDN